MIASTVPARVPSNTARAVGKTSALDDVEVAGAQGHADTDLLESPSGGKRDGSVQTHQRDRQGDAPEGENHQRDPAELIGVFLVAGLERPDAGMQRGCRPADGRVHAGHGRGGSPAKRASTMAWWSPSGA